MSLTINEELTVKHCPECGITYAIPKAFIDKRHEDGKHWYCPNGHSIVFTESKVDKLEKQLHAVNTDLGKERYWRNETIADLEHQKNLTRSQKAAKTRAQNKLKAHRDGHG